MSTDTDTDETDRIAIRKRIRETIRAADEPPARADVLDTVAARESVAVDAVADELDACEREGFVYLVGETPVVKLP
jgi:hypothetical protein